MHDWLCVRHSDLKDLSIPVMINRSAGIFFLICKVTAAFSLYAPYYSWWWLTLHAGPLGGGKACIAI
jgi:hypothetical protein